jgi:excisionase family DNA binding protein
MAQAPRRDLRLFSINKTAERLDVSVRSVRRWIKAGELRSHRLGGQLRISEDDLQAYLARRRE